MRRMKQKNILHIFLMAAFLSSTQILIAQERYWVPADLPKSQYVIEAAIDVSSNSVKGKEAIIFTNDSSKPIRTLAFQWEISDSASITVLSEGNPLTLLNPLHGAPTEGPLFYLLHDSVKPGFSFELDIEFESVDMFDGQDDAIILTQWFPRLWWDGLPMHDAFRVNLNVPEGYALAVSGRQNEETGFFENDGARTFGIFLGKGMNTKSREVDDVLISAVFTDKGAECAGVCLETAVDAVEFYKDWLGFYPFGHPTVAMGGYPVASGIVAIHGQESFESKPLVWWKRIAAHEIGHEYWGEYVMDPDDPAWLWIGMGIYADTEYGLSRNLRDRRSWMGNYLDGLRDRVDTTVDVPPERTLFEDYDRNNIITHSKGYSIISALEAVLGKETFMKIYARCLREYGGKRLGYRQLWQIAEEESGENLGWFFDQWVRSNKYLCHRIASQDCFRQGEKFVTTVRVERLGTMLMPIPVKAVFEDGSEQVKHTHRYLNRSTLRFESETELAELVLNPGNLFAMLDSPRPPTDVDFALLISDLPWTGAGEKALKVYEEIKKVELANDRRLFRLALTLYDGGYYAESLDVLVRLSKLHLSWTYRFATLVWMGHLKDLMRDRQEAIEFYNEALRHEDHRGLEMTHTQYGIQIDRKWVEERLKTPFQRESK